MYTTTHSKLWPLTSTCNWRNSSKWQNALAGLGPMETLLPATVTVTAGAFTAAQESVLCRHPSHPVSCINPVCSGLERDGLLLLPNENGFRAAVAGANQILNRKVATWKDLGLNIGLFLSVGAAARAPQVWFWLYCDLSLSLEFPVSQFPSLWNGDDNTAVPSSHCCHGDEMSAWRGVWPVASLCKRLEKG